MFDCIIVGAGPAGGSAAYHLAKRGYGVLILEKAKLPRCKPCGGGVSPIIQEWFDFDWSPAISCQAQVNRYTWNHQDAVEVSLEDLQPIWMVRREVFDYYLIGQAQRQGAQLQDKTKALGIEFKSDRWQVKTTNGVFESQYLIAADGGKGMMSQWLGFRRRYRQAGALEIEVPIKQQSDRRIHFEFGMIQGGYIWNFPKADGYSIGVGSLRGSKRQNYGQILNQYGQMFDLDMSTGTAAGHPIYLWDGNQTLHTQNALLAGEAACVVDPFTAEGIRPSMFSGIKAAEAVANALAGVPDALAQYSITMQQEWGAQMIWAKRLAQLFYRFPSAGYQLGVKRPSATIKMYKILSGELKYSEVARSGINRLSRGGLTQLVK